MRWVAVGGCRNLRNQCGGRVAPSHVQVGEGGCGCGRNTPSLRTHQLCCLLCRDAYAPALLDALGPAARVSHVPVLKFESGPLEAIGAAVAALERGPSPAVVVCTSPRACEALGRWLAAGGALPPHLPVFVVGR